MAKGVCRRYGKHEALRDFSLKMAYTPAGQILNQLFP